MADKAKSVGPASIHRNQLLHNPEAARSTEVVNFVQSTVQPTRDQASNGTTQSSGGVGKALVDLLRRVQCMIYDKDNIVRWELTILHTLMPNVPVFLPFNQERIIGKGAWRPPVAPPGNNNWWRFSPPARYAGAYRVSAYYEFLANNVNNVTSAVLQVRIKRRGDTNHEFWAVLDHHPLNPPDNDVGPQYLEQVILKGTCNVWLNCGDEMVIACQVTSGAPLPFTGPTSYYGYVDAEFLGCNGARHGSLITPYLLPPTN